MSLKVVLIRQTSDQTSRDTLFTKRIMCVLTEEGRFTTAHEGNISTGHLLRAAAAVQLINTVSCENDVFTLLHCYMHRLLMI